MCRFRTDSGPAASAAEALRPRPPRAVRKQIKTTAMQAQMADADMQTLSQQMQELERSNQELIAKLERLRTGEPDERDTPSAAAKIKEALAAAAYSEAEQSASKSASKGASKGAFSAGMYWVQANKHLSLAETTT